MQPIMSVNPSRSASSAMLIASVNPPVLSSLMFTASYLPTSDDSDALAWTLSSAQMGIGRAIRARASSQSAGKAALAAACAMASGDASEMV